MSCQDFSSTYPVCRTVTLIQPDDVVLTASSSGSTDPALEESGSELIPMGAGELKVTFIALKASSAYRFEYLYIDAIGGEFPGIVAPVVVSQTIYGFTVDLAGIPIAEGYVLHWRVVVKDITTGQDIDKPESLRLQLPQARVFTATLHNVRSSTEYGFSELRVENLVDPVAAQRIILAQLVAKTILDFTVGLNPPPDTDNYYLVARTP